MQRELGGVHWCVLGRWEMLVPEGAMQLFLRALHGPQHARACATSPLIFVSKALNVERPEGHSGKCTFS